MKCPFCGSGMIEWESQMGMYYCKKCTNFFHPPKDEPIIKEKVEEEISMPTGKLDYEQIKALADNGKTIPEIIAETGYRDGSVRSVIKKMGLKCKDARKYHSVEEKTATTILSSNVEKQEVPTQLTALAMLIAERNQQQEIVFNAQERVKKLNIAIEALS